MIKTQTNELKMKEVMELLIKNNYCIHNEV